jgi:dUTP pyrophosphatase
MSINGKFGVGIAQFEKVSFEQWKNDMLSGDFKEVYSRFPETALKEMYDAIKLPKRATTGSAGHDFFLPMPMLDIPVNESINIPTGIRCKMDEGWVLKIYPRSGHGFKFGVHLANTCGIVDSDYFFANNEGHIHVKLVNDSMLKKQIELSQGDAFCQGVFVPYGTTVNDEASAKRVGGFGSTSSN